MFPQGSTMASSPSSPETNATLDRHNGTVPWFVHDCTVQLDYDWCRISLFLLYLLVFVGGLLENAVVLWVNWRRRHAAGGVLLCVLNVSLADMLVVLLLPFFMMEEAVEKVWLWGRFLCKATNLLYLLAIYASSFFLAAMTLERYLALARPGLPPLFPAGGRRRWALCAALWAVALLLALLENVHVDLLEWEEPGCYMLPQQDFTAWFVSSSMLCLLFQFLLPAALILTCNLLIARHARRRRQRRQLWLVHVYSLVFVACWLPFHAVSFLMMVDDLHPFVFSCNLVEVLYFSFNLVQALTWLHSLANPILYNFLSSSFRTNLVGAVADLLPRGPPPPPAEEGAGPKPSPPSTSQSDVGS